MQQPIQPKLYLPLLTPLVQGTGRSVECRCERLQLRLRSRHIPIFDGITHARQRHGGVAGELAWGEDAVFVPGPSRQAFRQQQSALRSPQRVVDAGNIRGRRDSRSYMRCAAAA